MQKRPVLFFVRTEVILEHEFWKRQIENSEVKGHQYFFNTRNIAKIYKETK
jgi:NAD-dependent DNA ligase